MTRRKDMHVVPWRGDFGNSPGGRARERTRFRGRAPTPPGVIGGAGSGSRGWSRKATQEGRRGASSDGFRWTSLEHWNSSKFYSIYSINSALFFIFLYIPCIQVKGLKGWTARCWRFWTSFVQTLVRHYSHIAASSLLRCSREAMKKLEEETQNLDSAWLNYMRYGYFLRTWKVLHTSVFEKVDGSFFCNFKCEADCLEPWNKTIGILVAEAWFYWPWRKHFRLPCISYTVNPSYQQILSWGD